MKTSSPPEIPRWIPLDRIERIVAGMEGDWSPTAVDVWRRGEGASGFAGVRRRHPEHRPSLELYLGDYWIGVPCFERVDGENVFDEVLALSLIEAVEATRR